MQDHDTYRIADGRRGSTRRGEPLHPPGWLADPLGRHEIRYWDGWEWTGHVSDAGIPATDPVAAGCEADLPVPCRIAAAGDRLIPPVAAAGSSRRLWPWLVIAAAVLLVAVIVTGTRGPTESADTRVRLARRSAPVPATTATTLPVPECQRIVLEVQAGMRAMTAAGYRRACGELPPGVMLAPATTTVTGGAFEVARRP